MGDHRDITRRERKLVGGMLLGAVASGLAVGSLSGAGTASATCASISGIGSGNGCESTFSTFAVGVGDGATASAKGSLSGAVAIGTKASAITVGSGSLSYAGGENARASAYGNLSIAATQGKNSSARAGGFIVDAKTGAVTTPDSFNYAFNFGDDGNVLAGGPSAVIGSTSKEAGFGNLAVNTGGGTDANPNFVQAIGALNNAWNFAGSKNSVSAAGFLNHASNLSGDNNVVASQGGTGLTNPGFNVASNSFGSGNRVIATSDKAGQGFAIALNTFRDKSTVIQSGPGFNFNGSNNPAP